MRLGFRSPIYRVKSEAQRQVDAVAAIQKLTATLDTRKVLDALRFEVRKRGGPYEQF